MFRIESYIVPALMSGAVANKPWKVVGGVLETAVQNKKIIHVDHALVSILESCCSIKSLTEYNNLLTGQVRRILPHDMGFSGIVDLWKLGVVDHVNSGFPAKYISHVISESGTLKSPLIRCWKKKYQPFYVNDIQVMSAIDSGWVNAAQESKVRNIVVHGLVDFSGRLSSFFCFANTPVGWSNKHCHILNLLLPSLHVALKRVLAKERNQRAEGVALSSREVEIINLLQSGKTNKQIALTLMISENTVRNHIHNVFEKLNVNNRGEAVSKALQHRLIHV